MAETPEAILLRIKAQNSARQRKYYENNAEKVKEARRFKYKEGVDAFKTLQGLPLTSPHPFVAPAQPNDEAKPQPFDSKKSYDTYQDILEKLNTVDRNQYKSGLKTVFNILATNKYLTTLHNSDKVIKAIEGATFGKKHRPYKINSKKQYFQIICRTITYLSLPIPTEDAAAYVLKFKTLQLDSADDNAAKFDSNKVLGFKEYLIKIKDHFGPDSKQFVMASMYDEITVRDDFQLKLVSSLKEASEDLSEQYLIVPKTGVLTVIINHYKTSKKNGQIKETISVDLSKLVRQYITDTELAFGDYLFGNAKSNSVFVSKMNKEIGVTGSISAFRHMKASKEGLTNAERVVLAAKMKHTPATNKTYARKIKK